MANPVAVMAGRFLAVGLGFRLCRTGPGVFDLFAEVMGGVETVLLLGAE